VRQAANLWAVKAQPRQQLLAQVGFRPAGLDLGQLPMPVCRFGRAYRCRRLAGLAAFGRDEGAKQTYYGLRAHLRVCWPGVICDGHLAPANLHDLTLAEELLVGVHGWALGIGPTRAPSGRVVGPTKACGCWHHPVSAAISAAPARPPGPGPAAGREGDRPVVERYHAKRVWARDAWHLWSRWQRKLLSRTLAVDLCQQTGLGSLRFADPLTT
jgi:hypothetical protein